MSKRSTDKQVLIIGGGPTGMALACKLIKFGIKCRVVEAKAEATKESKAININSASLQMFDRIGIADRFLKQGKEVKHVYGHWKNKRLIHINYNLIKTPYTFFMSLPQSKTERVISDYLVELGGCVERNIEFLELSTHDGCVEAVLKHKSGEIETESYDYLIACDGAKSTVRNFLKVPFTGHDYNQHYHLLDGFIEWDGPIEDTHYYVTEEGYFIIAPMVGGYHRMVIFDKTKGTKTCSFDECQQLIDEYGPGGVKLKKITWQSKGFFYNRIIENFRYDKRVFFAGDSAHIFSPLGGHGMNTCFQDIDNLSWKLAGVMNHEWPDKILDTYSEERKLIAQQLIIATDFSTRLINKIESEFTTNIVNWFPLLRNKENIRKRYPYQFSGLAQKYSPSEFIYSHGQTDYEKEKIVGRYLPFTSELKSNFGSINTYQLCDQIPVILIFGACTIDVAQKIISQGFHVYNITDKPSDMDFIDPLFTNLVDSENSLKTQCELENGELLLLRPDGMVGFKCHMSQVELLNQFLDGWFQAQMAIR